MDSGDHGRDGNLRQMHGAFGTRPEVGQEHHEARPMLLRLPRREWTVPAVAGAMHGLRVVLQERDGVTLDQLFQVFRGHLCRLSLLLIGGEEVLLSFVFGEKVVQSHYISYKKRPKIKKKLMQNLF